MKIKKGFEVYEIEEYKTPTYYVALKKNIFGKEKTIKINFDVDTRGGLKIIPLEEVDLNCNGITRKLIFSNIKGNFIPVNIYKRGYGSEEMEVPEKIHRIFENRYLKTKPKYGLYDGVPEKIVFSRIEKIEGRNAIDYTNCLYNLN